MFGQLKKTFWGIGKIIKNQRNCIIAQDWNGGTIAKVIRIIGKNREFFKVARNRFSRS
jgi:hypothetical protein